MSEIYSCAKCDFTTYIKSNYNRHLLSIKHLEKTRIVTDNKIYCNYCSKSFIHKKNLENHVKKCNKNCSAKVKSTEEEEIPPSNVKEEKINTELNQELVKEMLMSFITQNGGLNNLMMESLKHHATNESYHHNKNKNSNNTNSHNTFNLNFFLNEQCKDAMNLSEFVNQIKITSSDLENIGKNGFVNGITDIIYTCLENCGIYKRPIHCTDAKRETMHVKEDGVWKKENPGNPNIKESIEKICNKCFCGVSSWMKEHPKCRTLDTNEYDLWLKIAKNVSTNDEKSQNKIAKNVANATTINEEKNRV